MLQIQKSFAVNTDICISILNTLEMKIEILLNFSDRELLFTKRGKNEKFFSYWLILFATQIRVTVLGLSVLHLVDS